MKVQSPSELTKHQLAKIGDRFSSSIEARGLPVAISQVRPARLLAAYDVGGEIASLPLGRGHASGRITTYVKHGDGKIVFALTAAHVLDQLGAPAAAEGMHVYCDVPNDGEFASPSGIVRQVKRLEINPLNEAGPYLGQQHRSLDSAIVEMTSEAIRKRNKTSLRSVFYDNQQRSIGQKVITFEELVNDFSVGSRAWKVRSQTSDTRLDLTSPVSFIEVITPSGEVRAATDLVEFEGEDDHIKPGDSGSLILFEKGARPVAMLVAQGRSSRVVDKVKRAAYYAVPLHSIFETAKVSLI